MKHFLYGVLFFFFVFPSTCFATISLKISDLIPKDDYYEVTAVVSGMSSSSATFVQGMFTKVDSSKYFGFTFSKKGEWLGYDGSPEKSYVLENYLELKNDSPQKIFIKPNYDDKNYGGPGKYLLKVKRYTASGSSSDYADNSVEVDLNHSTPTPVSTTVPTPSLRVSAIAEPKQSPPTVTPTTISKTPTPTQKSTLTPILGASPVKGREDEVWRGSESISPQILSTQSSTIESSPSSTIYKLPSTISTSSSLPLSDKNIFLVGMSVFSLSGGLLYFRLKNL